MTKRIVLAYSGDLETAVTITALAAADQAEVVTLTLDLGAGRDLEEVRDRAIAAGAARAHVIDAREEFVQDFVLPSLKAGALRDGRDPMAALLARPLVHRKLQQVADIEGAGEVVDRSNVDVNLWGHQAAPRAATKPAEATPDTPAWLEIAFEQGVPSAVNGVAMGMTELIESLSIIARHHGVGRIESGESHIEAPAAVVLHAAYTALTSSLLTADAARAWRERAAVYADLISQGKWFTPEREAMDALNAAALRNLTGSVRIRLSRASLQISADEPHPAVAAPHR